MQASTDQGRLLPTSHENVSCGSNSRSQCDEIQPVCGRCKKSQRTCYGMRKGPWSSVIHLENTYASGVAKRPRGPRSTRTAAPAGNLAVMQLPDTDLKTRAVTYFWHHHLRAFTECQDIFQTVYDDFLPIWNSRKDSILLKLSGSCISLAIFSQTHRHPPAALAASLSYQKLLETTQKTLLTLNEENIELYLIASFCMGRYEGAIYSPASTNSRNRAFSHHSGALSILKIWKEQYSHRVPATDIIRHSRQGLIRSALMRNIELPEWMMEGTVFGEQGLDLEYHRIVIRIASVRYRVAELLRTRKISPVISDQIGVLTKELDGEAREIDASLQIWSDHLRSTSSYGEHLLPDPYPWPMRDFYTPMVWSYSSHSHAAAWCNYYSTRILINSTRLKILEVGQLRANSENQRCQAQSLIKVMADNLASSLPFCLERFKVINTPNSSSERPLITLNTNEDIKPHMAMLVVWPVTLAAFAGGVDPGQQKWFKSELSRLGRIVGYGIMEFAETSPWSVNELNFEEERGKSGF
jgi:hypothetical protein